MPNILWYISYKNFLPKVDETIEIDIRVLERLDDLEKENQDLKNQINELEKFLASQSGDLQNINDDLTEIMELTIQPELKNEFGKNCTMEPILNFWSSKQLL